MCTGIALNIDEIPTVVKSKQSVKPSIYTIQNLQRQSLEKQLALSEMTMTVMSSEQPQKKTLKLKYKHPKQSSTNSSLYNTRTSIDYKGIERGVFGSTAATSFQSQDNHNKLMIIDDSIEGQNNLSDLAVNRKLFSVQPVKNRQQRRSEFIYCHSNFI